MRSRTVRPIGKSVSRRGREAEEAVIERIVLVLAFVAMLPPPPLFQRTLTDCDHPFGVQTTGFPATSAVGCERR